MAQEPKQAKGTVKKPPAAMPKDAAPTELPGVKGKIVRKDQAEQARTQPIVERTVDFEMPDEELVAATYLNDAFEDEEVAQAKQAWNAASDQDTTEVPLGETESAEKTHAYFGDTIASESPLPLKEDLPVGARTEPNVNQTVDIHPPKEPAPRPSTPVQKQKPAVPSAGAKKDGAMATTMLAGKYKLLKKLGQGGMGAVYKAHDEKLDRIVAIKVLAKDLAGKGDYVLRFEREARVMVKLDHPNVIRCYDFDKDEGKGLHYLAIEYVDGGTVESWLKKQGRFSIGDALHVILKAAAGLQHAHEKSLIHRDVKPDNLLLTREGIVKVADLGLAKATNEDTNLTKTGAGAGTPIYMAPEQARDVKHVDLRVDVYALGIMLYVFLTGQPPFQGNTIVELVTAKEKGKFDPMRKHNDEVPSKLDLIVDKMISKDPKSRYASCQEVIDEIEPLGLANEYLSFIEANRDQASDTVMSGPKATATSGPAKVAAKTTGPGKAAAKTTGPAAPPAMTSITEEEETEKDVWYWNFVTEAGKTVTKKMNTEQIRTLIKSGHLDPKAQLSKSEKGGYRAAGTFPEFQAIFKSLKTATKANVKGAKYRDKYKEIEEEDARRRKYGWISRMFKSFGSTMFGLLWIAVILAVVGGAIFGVYKYMNP